MTKYICTKDYRSIKQGDICEVDAVHAGWITQIYVTFNKHCHIMDELCLQSHFNIMEGE